MVGEGMEGDSILLFCIGKIIDIKNVTICPQSVYMHHIDLTYNMCTLTFNVRIPVTRSNL